MIGVAENATVFLKYTYPEWKDLAEHFLTLASATLVFSITFSEKIVEIKSAGDWERRAMLASWVAMIASIIVAGISICFLLWSVSIAAYQSTDAYQVELVYGRQWFFYWDVATWILVVAGCAYTFALLCLVLAAWLATRRAVRPV